MSKLIKRTLTNIYTIENVTFYPGVNKVSDADMEKLEARKEFRGQLQTGALAEVKKPVVASKKSNPDSDENESASSITEMNAQSAIAVIRETYAIPLLEDMHQEEGEGKGRTTVINAIEDQIKEIKKQPETDDEEEEE